MPSPEKFKRTLQHSAIAPTTIEKINSGYENLLDRSPKKERAAYFQRAMEILKQETSPEQYQHLLEENACCLGGQREKASKAFAKNHQQLSIDEKLDLIKEVPYMGIPTRNPDGSITVAAVSYIRDGHYACSCSNFNGVKLTDPVSKIYCYCCAGHFKHHYEIMLGVKLKTRCIISSPLDSQGEQPCVIQYEIAA